ncbi:MAG TPA: redoxin domain-containing protein [Actinomycetota bacterium]|nr:redoxin domain-containing protein [Actinomycetota bacterium]
MSAELEERPDRPGGANPYARRALALAIVIVPVLAFTLLLATGLGRDPRERPAGLVAEPAPSFSLPRLGGGERVTSDSMRGRVVVVNFWASWCIPCREEHPALLRAWERYRDRGVVFVGVNFEDTEESAIDYAEEQGGDWPLVSDPGSRTAIDFGVFGVPETFVIAPDGTIVAKEIGAVSYEWLTSEIDSALRQDGSA